MFNKKKNILSTIISLILIAIFTFTCCYVYLNNLNKYAFWISLIISAWFIDVVFGCYFFYKKNFPDEFKAFWLAVMIAFPICGVVFAFILNFNNKITYNENSNNQTKILLNIFNSKKTIKIYANSFFVDYDIVEALNYQSWNDVQIQIIVSKQKSETRQKVLNYTTTKLFSNKIKFYVTNKKIEKSFIIFDDKTVISNDKNFNLSCIFKETNLSISNDVQTANSIWNSDLTNQETIALEPFKITGIKKLVIKLLNIFYPFY